MEVLVEHLGSVQFEITARQHRVVSDQPVEQGGFDEGMTPPELMLASLKNSEAAGPPTKLALFSRTLGQSDGSSTAS